MKKNSYKIIGSYEVIQGILLAYILSVIIPNVNFSQIPDSYKVLAIGSLIFSVVATMLLFVSGIFLWKEKKNGIIMSVIAQAIQIPFVMVKGVTYLFASGVSLIGTFKIMAETENPGFFLQFHLLQAQFEISYNEAGSPFTIGINIFALFLVILLIKKYKNKSNAERV